METAPKKTVLIVEDETDLLQALVDAFTAEGFTALGATNGDDGLAVAYKAHPDIVLLDIVMPKMDGLSMLKHLRNDAWGKAVPVIILTNLSDFHSVAAALSADVHDFLVKSNWEIDKVVAAVRKRLTKE